MMRKSEESYCVFDWETFSEADLKKVGAYEYSRHPSTEILCLAWRVGTRETLKTAPVHHWAPAFGDSGLSSFLSQLKNPGVRLICHNSYFEQVITAHVLPKYTGKLPPIKLERWVCTASLARALALPGKLEEACLALDLPVKKDMDGHRLMLKVSKPRKPTKHNPSVRHDDPKDLLRLIEYCKKDVEAETHLFLKLPPLSAKERQVWLLDQKINHCGPLVDRPLVKAVIGMISEEKKTLDRKTSELTWGDVASPREVASLLKFLKNEGCDLPDLRAGTVEDALRDGLATGVAKELLELRQGASKSSTAKYLAFEERSRTDGRLRDILVYHGPSTGRWAGAGAQLQNLPRGTIADTIGACGLLAGGHLDTVRLFYDKPMEVFASACRSMLIAPPGYTLDVGDYSAIEARMLFWLAGHEKGLDAYREGRDLYKELAAVIYGVAVADVTKAQRTIGKVATLAAGYGMGPKKFVSTCYAQGKTVIDEALAKRAIGSYRTTNYPVAALWQNLEQAAIAAVKNPQKAFTINKTTWEMRAGFLWCLLPSGRRLSYPYPRIGYETTLWETKNPVLYVKGVNPVTKKWGEDKLWGGVLTANAVSALARDIMVDAMLRLDAAGPWRITLTVHDEVVAERKLGVGSHAKFLELLAEVPDWAYGVPLAVEGFESPRYKK